MIAWRAALCMGIASLAVICIAGFTFPIGSLRMLGGYFVALVAMALLKPSRYGKLAPWLYAAEAMILFTFISIVGAAASYVGLVQVEALADDWLIAGDAWLGFSWPAVMLWMESYPMMRVIFGHAYEAIFILPLATVILLTITGHRSRLYRFIVAHAVALSLTLLIASQLPAVAAFAYFKYDTPPANAAHYGRIIAGLRDGSLRVIDLSDLGGIVQFPSYHAGIAVLFVWALWPLARLRVPVVLLNLLMWSSAVPIGGHYALDLISGTLVALAGIAVANRLGRAGRVECLHADPAIALA